MLAEILKVIHVLIGFWLVAGFVGRGITLSSAARSEEVRLASALTNTSGRFERLMVIPASSAVLVVGLLTAWAQGQPLYGPGAWWMTVSLVLFLSIIPIIPLVFLPRGKRFESAMAGALAEDRITPELRAAFEDPVVAAAHAYEYAVMVAIIVLMVWKPF